MYWWREGVNKSLIKLNFRHCGSLVVSKSYSLEVTISRIKIIWSNDAFLSSVWDQLNKSIISDSAEHYQLGPQFYRLIFLTICTSALWICWADHQPTIFWLWKEWKKMYEKIVNRNLKISPKQLFLSPQNWIARGEVINCPKKNALRK